MITVSSDELTLSLFIIYTYIYFFVVDEPSSNDENLVESS